MPRDTLEQLLQQAFDHFAARRFDQADAAYRKALDRDPNNHEAVHMAAVLAHATGHTDRAAKLFARSIELAPHLGHYHQNAGKFFAEQDQHKTAIPYLNRAVELAPADPNIRANLANSLRLVGRLDEAEAAARAALAIAPEHPDALAHLGNVLREMGRVPDAIDAFTRAVRQRAVATVHDNLIFAFYNDPAITPGQFLQHHRAFARLYTDQLLPHAKPFPPDLDRSPDRKLRVGYVSADFRNHPVMAFMEAPLRSHDPAHFDVFCYSCTLREDDFTRRAKTYPLTFRDCRFDTFDQLVARIRNDRIDLLVDLSGHTAHNRLAVFAVRPAPVQISYLGDPGTTGMSQFDHRISDPVVDPPGQTESRYTESLLRLPAGFSCYTPAAPLHPDVSPIPALTAGHLTFGSLHALAKINDHVIDLWSRVLLAIPTSRLLMLRNTLTGSSLQRYADAFTSRGIDPARLDLRHTSLGPSHLHTYRHIDCCLDTFPFSGHTTACEALYNGVPTLTLAAGTPAADFPHTRLASSILTQIGLPDFITPSPDDFVSRAVSIASDLPKLATLRSTLRQQMLASPLCDAEAFTRQLESAYREAWRRFCAAPTPP